MPTLPYPALWSLINVTPPVQVFDYASTLHSCQVAQAADQLQVTAPAPRSAESTTHNGGDGAPRAGGLQTALAQSVSQSWVAQALNTAYPAPCAAFEAAAVRWMEAPGASGGESGESDASEEAAGQVLQGVGAPCFLPSTHKCTPSVVANDTAGRLCLPGYYVTGSERAATKGLVQLLQPHPFNHV